MWSSTQWPQADEILPLFEPLCCWFNDGSIPSGGTTQPWTLLATGLQIVRWEFIGRLQQNITECTWLRLPSSGFSLEHSYRFLLSTRNWPSVDTPLCLGETTAPTTYAINTKVACTADVRLATLTPPANSKLSNDVAIFRSTVSNILWKIVKSNLTIDWPLGMGAGIIHEVPGGTTLAALDQCVAHWSMWFDRDLTGCMMSLNAGLATDRQGTNAGVPALTSRSLHAGPCNVRADPLGR